VIALSISLFQEVELWEASCYGLRDELDHLINIGTNVNVATGVSTSFCYYRTVVLVDVSCLHACMLLTNHSTLM